MIEKQANLLKNINKTVGKLTQQSKRPLQENGMVAISKNACSHFQIFVVILTFEQFIFLSYKKLFYQPIH